MIDKLLSENEGKTLEFKENTNSPLQIIKTAIAFANTAGGIILIGVEDKTKKIIGINHVLLEEERISNLLFDSISPMLLPDVDIVSHSGKELLIINVPHIVGPFYLKRAGKDKGIFVRLGSSNRLADPETLANLQRLAKRIRFDEMPCIAADITELDNRLIQGKLAGIFKNISRKSYESLGLVRSHNKKKYATYGGLLLFSDNKTKWLPDAIIKCVCFASTSRKSIIDKREIKINLIDSVDEVILFIQRNTRVFAEIGLVRRVDIPEYPVEAVREAVINAVVHADYSIQGSSVQVSIYTDRIEIISQGGLPLGQTMNSALSGISKMRNPVIGRIFREIGMIETLGMGMLSIIQSYEDSPAKPPKFEEIDHFFKVTLYARPVLDFEDEPWMNAMQEVLLTANEVSTNKMAKIWGVSDRTARTRLNKMLKRGLIKRNAKSKTDPSATYSKI